ncbi:hypothetical protein ACXYTJ_16040 [Gilvimarinus sp. F26214L]|uniref:hypothetical protein n=1 Tax=Gilvimarinus sp. DZF01 TaxID=3461371 RepID=UPI00404554D9
MTPSARELIDAKEATAELLEQLDLRAYMFEVEAGEDAWEVHLECARDGDWQTVAMPVNRDQLLASRSDASTREALLAEWRSRLAD